MRCNAIARGCIEFSFLVYEGEKELKGRRKKWSLGNITPRESPYVYATESCTLYDVKWAQLYNHIIWVLGLKEDLCL